MRFPSLILLVGSIFLPASLFASEPAASAAGITAKLTVTQKEQIPGQTLKPGAYIISILDSLHGERYLVRIDSLENKSHFIFLGVPSQHGGIDTGAYLWSSGLHHQTTLRGFSFPYGLAVDFVYPKADAAELAKTNDSEVVAVDYESDHVKPQSGLSDDDLRSVNLWMLSLTTAGSTNHPTPAILAKKYQPPVTSPQQVAAAPTTPVAPAATPRTTQVASLEQPALPQAQPRAPRIAHRAPAVAVLPHTASLQPLVLLGAMLSLLAAAGIFTTLFRTRTSQA